MEVVSDVRDLPCVRLQDEFAQVAEGDEFRERLVPSVEGVVAFDEGAKLAFGGNLLAAMRPRGGGWTTFATASSFIGSPVLPGQGIFDLRIVDNGDGSKSMQSRIKAGFALSLR